MSEYCLGLPRPAGVADTGFSAYVAFESIRGGCPTPPGFSQEPARLTSVFGWEPVHSGDWQSGDTACPRRSWTCPLGRSHWSPSYCAPLDRLAELQALGPLNLHCEGIYGVGRAVTPQKLPASLRICELSSQILRNPKVFARSPKTFYAKSYPKSRDRNR